MFLSYRRLSDALKRKKPPKKSLLKKGSNLSMGGASNIDTTQPHVYCNVDSTAGTTTAVSHHGAIGGRRSGAVNSRTACRTSSRNSNLVTVVTSSSGRGGASQTTNASRTSTFHSSRNASASNAPPTAGQQQSRSNSRTNLTIAPPTMLSAPDLSCPVATAMTSGSFSIAVNREWMALPSLPRSTAVDATTTGQGAGFGSNVEMGFAPPPPRSAPASTGGRAGQSARQKFFGGEQVFLTHSCCCAIFLFLLVLEFTVAYRENV